MENIFQKKNVNKDNFINTPSEIKRMIEKINLMSESEHHQVFKIVCEDTNKYTENQNGVFINLSKLSESTLLKIYQFVDYWEKQSEIMNNSELLIKKFKENDPQDLEKDSKEHEVTNDYISSVATDSKIEDLYSMSHLTDGEQEIVNVNQENRKNNLILNKVKPRFGGSAARIAKKCMSASSASS